MFFSRLPRDPNEPDLDRLPTDSSNICEPLSSTVVCRGLNDSDTLCQPAKWAGEAIQEAINTTRVAMRALEKALRSVLLRVSLLGVPSTSFGLALACEWPIYHIWQHGFDSLSWKISW